MPSSSGRPKALETILFGGLIAGVLDGLDAAIYYDWVSGVVPARLCRGIASAMIWANKMAASTMRFL